LRCKNCGHRLADHTAEDSRNYLLCSVFVAGEHGYRFCKCPGFDLMVEPLRPPQPLRPLGYLTRLLKRIIIKP
jgi:hypothetical protein